MIVAKYRFEIDHPMLNGMWKSEWMNRGDVFIAGPFKGERVRDGQTVPSVLSGVSTTEAPGVFSELSKYGAVVEGGVDLERLRRGLPCKPNIFSISRAPSKSEFELHGGCLEGQAYIGAPESIVFIWIQTG